MERPSGEVLDQVRRRWLGDLCLVYLVARETGDAVGIARVLEWAECYPSLMERLVPIDAEVLKSQQEREELTPDW